MAAPTFTRPIQGSPPDQFVENAQDVAALNAALEQLYLAVAAGAPEDRVQEIVAAIERLQQDADRAEAARDSSFANAKGAATIADARALVADDETFIVYAPDAMTFDAYRRLTSSTQVFLGRYPVASSAQAGIVTAILNSGYATFAASSRTHFVYSATANALAQLYIPDRAEGSQLTFLYRIRDKTGGDPRFQLRYNDNSFGPDFDAEFDGEWHYDTLTVEAGKTAHQIWLRTSGAASGEVDVVILDGASKDDVSFPLGSDFSSLLWDMRQQIDGLASGGDGVSDQQLRGWALGESIRWSSVTRNDDGVATSASVMWPDGSAGTFTATDISELFRSIDAYTITHIDSGKFVTQPAVTRNDSGAVTAQPVLTVGAIE